MLDFLFTQSTTVVIVIGGILAIGFGFLLLQWRVKLIPLGPRPRKKVGIATAVVSILLGLIIFSLAVITAFRFHASLFHYIWFAVEVLLMTSLFTWLGYKSSSKAFRQLGLVVTPESGAQRGEEIAPPSQSSRSGPQPKEAQEE
jgi:hypothetical protein